MDALARRAGELRDVELVNITTMGQSDLFKPEYKDSFFFQCPLCFCKSAWHHP